MTYKDSQGKLAEYQRREEQQRKNYAENHKGSCVPWRGAGGKIGRCIYCGKTHTWMVFNTENADDEIVVRRSLCRVTAAHLKGSK